MREWEEGCRGRSRVELTPLAGMIELGSYSVVSPPEKELYRAALEVLHGKSSEYTCILQCIFHVEVTSVQPPLYAGPKLGHVNKINCFSSFCLQKFGEGGGYLLFIFRGQRSYATIFYRCETGI